MPAISNSPCTVPSSPHGPCRSGNTTSTSAKAPSSVGSPASGNGSPSSTCGSFWSWIASAAASSATRTQRPLVVIPTGTTSYFVRSMAASTLPALTQEISCSVLRPPNTTATRTFGTSVAVFGGGDELVERVLDLLGEQVEI